MPEIVSCPQCERKLRVPDDLVGKKVKCPTCATTFTATVGGGEGPPPVPEDEPRVTSRRPSAPPPPEDEFEEERPSRRPAPRRAFDEEPYEDEDRPRRRRRRASSGEAMDAVNGPAVGLMVTAIIGLVCGGISLIMNIAGVGMAAAGGGGFGGKGGAGAGNNPMADMMGGTVGVISNIIGLAVGVVILIGAIKMKKLEAYGLAMTASILAMIPCISPCCLLGLPMGIWAVVALNKPEVKDAFT